MCILLTRLLNILQFNGYKIETFLAQICGISSPFGLKHRLGYLLNTVLRRFCRVFNIYVCQCKDKKIIVHLCKPQFYYIKFGFKVIESYMGVLV